MPTDVIGIAIGDKTHVDFTVHVPGYKRITCRVLVSEALLSDPSHRATFLREAFKIAALSIEESKLWEVEDDDA